jgi:alpha-mannosidase
MGNSKIFCVISHTHWDREWYIPFEAFRVKLVDLMDRLLVTIKKYPDFIFHLDAQTIVLEDYLEIRPENADTLRKYIKKGNIIIGPWYLQNDFYLTSGEATIRNLIEGHRISAAYGVKSKVGYAPDQFGNISQLPQILSNFDIDNVIFGRGYSMTEKDEAGNHRHKTMPSEFIWRGADGTEALAIHMRYWYNNAQRFSENEETALLLCDTMKRLFSGISVVPYILMMNGVDHLEAQDNLLPILDKRNENLKDGDQIKQYVFDDYISDVKRHISDNKTEQYIHEGELRSGGDWEILKGTLSSRPYLKIANVAAQNMLENRLEPIYAMLEAFGLKNSAPEGFFHYLWRQLMKNHPHDSICGCSRDEVHAHMEDNYEKIMETANVLYDRAINLAAAHLKIPGFSDENYIIAAANTTEAVLSGFSRVRLMFPKAEKVEKFSITDADGKNMKFRLISKQPGTKNVFSPINLPGNIDADVYDIYLETGDIAPFSFKGFIVWPNKGKLEKLAQNKTGGSRIENEFIGLDIDKSGKVALTDKARGITYANFIYLEENYDRGDSYVYNNAGDAPLLSTDPEIAAKTKVVSLENNEYAQTCKILYELKVPAGYNYAARERSAATVVCYAELELTLKKYDKKLYVSYSIDNKAKDHRIRLVFSPGLAALASTADIPFDIVTHGANDHYFNTMSKVLPNTSFAALTDEKTKAGLAVLSKGQHEYEHLTDSDNRSALAFTIVRSTGFITHSGNPGEIVGDTFLCPENQLIRKISGEFAVLPFEGDVTSAGIPGESKAFRNPAEVCFAACDTKKFSGGRTAVQDTRLEELFYLPDPYENKKIPSGAGTLALGNSRVLVSAYKISEDRKARIVRLFNPTNETQSCTVKTKGKIQMSRMDERVTNVNDSSHAVHANRCVTNVNAAKENITEISLKPKEIVTLRIT